MNQKQKKQTWPTPKIDPQMLTVEYWRERFKRASADFDGLSDIIEYLSSIDSEFAGVRGLYKVQNIHYDKGNLQMTAKAAMLLEEKPKKLASPKVSIARQKLATT